ncbi:MAG: type II toxin-antitoxin system VapC family toxin [Actinomycetota bacterium]
MELLLDTHAFLWWDAADSRISARWAETIADPANSVFVSAATAWEIAIKRRAGKLAFARVLTEVAEEYGFTWLPMSEQDAELAGDLDWAHRDPFDRMLVAQASRRRLALVTSDLAISAAPGVQLLPTS